MGCYECAACRDGDGRPKEVENNRQVWQEAQREDFHQRAPCLPCTAAGKAYGVGRICAHQKVGNKRWGREKCERDALVALSPLRGNDQTEFNISS